MEHQKLFSVIRKILGTLGLSPEAVDDIIDRITDFLSDKGDKSAGEPAYPYILSKDFLTPAEHNFFSVLRTTVPARHSAASRWTCTQVTEEPKPEAPRYPKCGSDMVLQTAKSVSNQAGQFWAARIK